MKQLIVNYDPESTYCELFHPYSKRFIVFVSQGIRPLYLRKFNQESKRWWVHHNRLPQVVAAGKRYFDHVDYRSLPPELQIKIVQFLEKEGDPVVVGSKRKTPHETLFVVPGAPPEVIKAAYRALAAKYHPDHGGDPEKFRKIDEAYKALK